MKQLILTFLTAFFVHQISAQEAKILITASDQMVYDTKEFEVTEGQKVILVLKNIGKIPVSAMGHNLVILEQGTMLPVFAAKCGEAKSTNYVPQDAESKKQIIAHTKLIGGGQLDKITFTAPTAGSYPFFCSYPGHFSVMQGVMKVKAK
jgi:azurin